MPVDYILFTLMKKLKEHNNKTIISIYQLAKCISEFLAETPLPKELNDSLLQDLDLDGEIEMIADKYAGYLCNEDGMIILSPYAKLDTIDNLLGYASFDYDEKLISIIDNFLEFNVPIYEIIGIKVETELYDKALELEKDIIDGYSNLARRETDNEKVPDSILNNLKRNIIKRKFIFNQIKNNLSIQEYNDLYRYSIEKADSPHIDMLKLKIENESLGLVMETDPFLRALFFIDNDKELIFSESFYKESKYNIDEGKTKELFYTKVIDVINNRTTKEEYDTTDDDLIYAKYRLMYVMDMLYQDEEKYNGYLFMNDRNNYMNFDEDYFFIEKHIFCLIDEVFMYTDKEMTNELRTDYNNTIISILIEAYYKLTKDERVIEAIKNHSNYGKHHFVTQLFDNTMNEGKSKTKRKEDK